RPGLVAAADCRAVHGGDERGRRSGGVAHQAQRRSQGQQRAAAGSWRRAGPGRCVAADLAVGHDVDLLVVAMKQRIAVLGSTGSIGTSTLDVVARHPDRFEVFALSAATQVDLLLQQCARFRPRFAVMASAAGLPPCLAAARAGKRLLLANKEALVVGGDVFLRAVRDGGATLLPID